MKKSGFIVNATRGFLGASRDGLVHDPLKSTPDGLVEVKLIMIKADHIRKGICKLVEGDISINRNHQYYFQVHQQKMFCCSKTWTGFAVKGGTEMYKERLLPKLDDYLPAFQRCIY